MSSTDNTCQPALECDESTFQRILENRQPCNIHYYAGAVVHNYFGVSKQYMSDILEKSLQQSEMRQCYASEKS